MTAVGIDFGNDSCVVAIPRRRGIDVLLNDDFKVETPALACFGEKQRYIGVYGAIANKANNPKNTISQIKRLIGRPFSDPELQRDLKALPFTVTEGPDKNPLIHAQYLGKLMTFTPTQVLAMVFSDLKRIADKNSKLAVVEGKINLKMVFGDCCCIGIPAYFTELQRRAVLNAAKIAGLRPIRLLHETTATALAYGINRTDLPETVPINIAFVDIGHASMQVCIAGFKKAQLKILAYSFNRYLGGRDFDEALFHHFAEKFKDDYKIDVYVNGRACHRLRVSCENLKKVLTENPKAHLNIECLIDEKDVNCFITRDEFEKICASLLERVKKPLEKALLEAGLKVVNIHSVEVVGSGTRVPAIIKILTDFFGQKPKRSMVACESVARGCALQCAIINPSYKVREFEVLESFPFNIAFSWKGSLPNTQKENGAENQHSTIVFPKGNPIPHVKELTLYKSETFKIDVQYADVELQTPAKISTYTIGPIRKTKSPHTTLKVKVRLNYHGIVSVDSATLLEEAGVEVPVVKDANKMDNGESSSDAAKPDVKAGAPKGKIKKWNIPVSENIYGEMSPADLQEAKEKELEMSLQDQLMEETRDIKNSLLAYVYKMRDKLDDEYREFVTELERDELTAKLQEVEDWLDNDGDDEAKNVYVSRLEELKKLGNPIKELYRTHTERELESEN